MPPARKPSLKAPATAALIVLVLLGWYVGTFYSVVDQFEGFAFYPESAGKHAETFFAPMEWLDRRLRPEVWEPSRHEVIDVEVVDVEVVHVGPLLNRGTIVPISEWPPRPVLQAPRLGAWESTSADEAATAEIPSETGAP